MISSSACLVSILPLHAGLKLACGIMAYAALAVTAAIDARKGIVPDWALLLASVILIPLIVIGFPLHDAMMRLMQALGFAAFVWAVNEAYYRLRRRDALGMGDAKWSAVAILGFGPAPLLAAWGIGAWLALGWLLAARLSGRRLTRIYFAPFLLAGLSAALAIAAALCR